MALRNSVAYAIKKAKKEEEKLKTGETIFEFDYFRKSVYNTPSFAMNDHIFGQWRCVTIFKKLKDIAIVKYTGKKLEEAMIILELIIDKSVYMKLPVDIDNDIECNLDQFWEDILEKNINKRESLLKDLATGKYNILSSSLSSYSDEELTDDE